MPNLLAQPVALPTLLVVLGMHRSGTSCLTGLLEEAGLSNGQTATWHPFNQKGNREDGRVNQLNETLLQTGGHAWNDPPPIGFDVLSCATPALRAQRDVWLAGCSAEGQARVIKDPRLLLTWSFWQEATPDARKIGIFRHPWAVACSVAARDPGLSLEDGLALWLAYNERLWAMCRQQPLTLLCFDLPPRDFVNQVRSALQRDFADWLLEGRLHTESLGAFYSKDLVHQAAVQPGEASVLSTQGQRVLAQAMTLYATLCECAGVAPALMPHEVVEPLCQLGFWLPRIDALRDAGQVQEALAICEQALAHVSDPAPLWRRRLRLRQEQGATVEEIGADLRRIGKECPQAPDLLLRGGEWLAQQGAHEAARDVFLMAVVCVPDWLPLRVQLGQCLLRLQQYEQASEHLLHAQKLCPQHLMVHLALMECWGHLGQRARAQEFYQVARQTYPVEQQAMVEHRWAEVLSRWGEHDGALQHRQRAVVLPQAAPHMVGALVREWLRRQQYAEALAVLDKADATGLQSPQLDKLRERCQSRR